MLKIFVSAFFAIISISVLFGQNGQGNGDGKLSETVVSKSDSVTLITYLPGKWETYLVDNSEISVLFPKLPLILEDTSNNCIGEKKTNYVAYSNRIVFVLQTVNKVKPNARCEDKKEFSSENFSERLKTLEFKTVTNAISKKSGKFNIYKTVFKNEAIWLYENGKNNGWYELRVVNLDEKNDIAEKFLNSFKFAKNQKGILIGKGANKIIGDEVEKTETKKLPVVINSAAKETSLKVVFQPRANYTDDARQNNIMGVVRLKVTLLANGSIGSVSVVNGLPFGLTEQAIVAARKIVFIPASSDSVNKNVSKTFEYRFTLY